MRPLEDPEDRVLVVSLAFVTVLLLMSLAACGRATTSDPVTGHAVTFSSSPASPWACSTRSSRGQARVVFALPE